MPIRKPEILKNHSESNVVTEISEFENEQSTQENGNSPEPEQIKQEVKNTPRNIKKQQSHNLQEDSEEMSTKKVSAFDFSKMNQQIGESKKMISGDPGVLSIINSSKNGKRITFPDDVYEKIGRPEQVNIVYDEQNIYIGEGIPMADIVYDVKYENKNSESCKKVLYCGVLINEMTKSLKLNFSNDRVCRTYYDVEYHEVNDKPFAVFKINEKEVM